MGHFDEPVRRMMSAIYEAWERKRTEDHGTSMTFNNMFSNVETLLSELREAMTKKFPELEPKISLDELSRGDGFLLRNLRLTSSKKPEMIIPLRVTIGSADVKVGDETVGPEIGTTNVVGKRIVQYFSP